VFVFVHEWAGVLIFVRLVDITGPKMGLQCLHVNEPHSLLHVLPAAAAHLGCSDLLDTRQRP
jgi:hypothetical protein